MNRHFLKEDIYIANKHEKNMKNSSISLISEMQMKTTVSYHLRPVRMAVV